MSVKAGDIIVMFLTGDISSNKNDKEILKMCEIINTEHIQGICKRNFPKVYDYLRQNEPLDAKGILPLKKVKEYPLSSRQSHTATSAIHFMADGDYSRAANEYIDCILNYEQTGTLDRDLTKSEIILLETLTYALMNIIISTEDD